LETDLSIITTSLFLYVVLAAILAGVGYIIQQAFFGSSGKKSKKSKKTTEKATPAKHRDESGKMVLDESWIPEQHLKKAASPKQSPKTRKRTTRAK
jgi:hypothetical protein